MYEFPIGPKISGKGEPVKDTMTVVQDAWSHNQIKSKLVLCELLEFYVKKFRIDELPFVSLLGGWYGILPFMLRVRDNIKIGKIESFDIDHNAVRVSDIINNKWEYEQWAFKATHKDANQIYYNSDVPHCVINTSTEHFESDDWFHRIPKGSIVCLQSTDMEHDEHINCVHSIDEFTNRYLLTDRYKKTTNFTYPVDHFNRFTMIGIK